MAWTQAQLDALKDAYASGHVHVQFADRAVTYRSLDEMERAIARIQAELSGETNIVRQIKIRPSQGY